MSLIARAQKFAQRAHENIDQRRKYTGESYIVHPAAVAELVASVPHTEAMIAAAWLHDVVEDTQIPIDEIKSLFGLEVAALVENLTDVSKPADGNRAARKAIDLAHTAQASPAAKTIKLADLIDNTKSIVALDPKFARVYLQEKAALLEVLKDGDPTLWNMAETLMATSWEQIETVTT